jgi:hypothetical protein
MHRLYKAYSQVFKTASFFLLGFWLELLDASFHLTKDFVFFLLVVFSSTCNALLELLDNLEQ